MFRLLFALWLFLGSASGQAAEFKHFSYIQEGINYPYAVHLPPGYSREKSWPVILFFHGMRETGRDGSKPTEVGLGPALAAYPERFPAIVVFPQTSDEEHWDDKALEASVNIVESVMRDYGGDRSRIYVTGISMGGSAAYRIAIAHPNAFAAVVPVSSPLVPLTWLTGIPDEEAKALAQTRIWSFINNDDCLIPAPMARGVIRKVRAFGGLALFTEFDRSHDHKRFDCNAGHNAWDLAYTDPQLVEWLFDQRRVSPPESLTSSN